MTTDPSQIEQAKGSSPTGARMPAGVIGSGSFGTTIATLLSHNTDVLLYTRQLHVAQQINTKREHLGYSMPHNIRATTSPQEVCEACNLIFPVVPSVAMRETIGDMAPFLRPYHILIHATKGFDLSVAHAAPQISRNQIHTMSEVITSESLVLRVGCLSGPNLAKEIMNQQPTATVIASRYDEVISIGQDYLQGPLFYVFGSHDIIGAEIAGALKNAIAIGSGILMGLGLGKNMQGMLITRGLNEMIHLGKAMGAGVKAFLGTAGIGDLVTTATSQDSRNYQLGLRIAQGSSVEEMDMNQEELAEGAITLKIIHKLSMHYRIQLPVLDALYRVTYRGAKLEAEIRKLMKIPYATDVDFL